MSDVAPCEDVTLMRRQCRQGTPDELVTGMSTSLVLQTEETLLRSILLSWTWVERRLNELLMTNVFQNV